MQFLQNQFLEGPTALTLTASFVNSSKTVDIGGAEQIVLWVKYTPLTGQSNRNITVRPEFNVNYGSAATALLGATEWAPLAIGVDSSPSSAVVTTTLNGRDFTFLGATGGTVYTFPIPIPGGYGKGTLMRVKVKEDGGADFGTVVVLASTYSLVGA